MTSKTTYRWKIAALLLVMGPAQAFSQSATGIITTLPTQDSVVALTFDACETVTPSYFDTTILNYLVAHRVPFTVFVSGKFASRNRSQLHGLSQTDFVEIENHSFAHEQHMEDLGVEEIQLDVTRNEDSIFTICGMKPRFFRFPGGNYSQTALTAVESLGYRVVHWTFESGDPDPGVSARHLVDWVLLKSHPASILIFHINGRGYATGTALPKIVEILSRKGFRFVLLKDHL